MIFLLAGFILIQFFMFLFFRSMLKIIGRRDNMDFSKLTAALTALNTTIQGLPAAIAALNTAAQAQIDAATTSVTNANSAIVAATTPAPAPAA